MATQRRVRDLVAQLNLDTTPADKAASRFQGTLFKTSSSTRQLQGGLAAINAEFGRMGPLGSVVGGVFSNLGTLAPRMSSGLELGAAKWGLLGEKSQAAAYGLSEAEAGVAKSEGALTSLSGAVGPVALGVGALAGALFGAIALAESGEKDYLALAHSVNEYSKATGESTEQASRQIQAFEVLGVDSQTLEMGMIRLGRQIDLQPAKLTKLGITIARNKDGSTDLNTTLLNVADAYSKSGDAAHRADLLYEAFGKAGVTLIPVLSQGADNLKRLEDQVNLVFTPKNIQDAERYRIEQGILGEQMKELHEGYGNFATGPQQKVTEGILAEEYAQQHLNVQTSRGAAYINGQRVSVEQLNAAHDKLVKQYLQGIGAQVSSTQAVQDNTQALQEQEKELEGLYSSYTSAASAQLGYGKEQQNIAGLADDYAQKQLDVKAANLGVKDARAALNDAIAGGAPKAARASKELALAQDALNAAISKYGQNSPQAQQATIRVGDAQSALNKAIAAYGPNSEDAAKASDALAQAQLRARDAARQLQGDLNSQEGQVLNTALAYVAQQKALAEAEGGSYGPTQSAKDLVAGLEQVRKELDPSNPLSQNLQGWIDHLEQGIPKELTTTITAKYQDFSAGTPGGTSQVGHFAAGGDYPAYRPRLTGEAGMELDVPQIPGHIYDHAATVGLVREALTGSGSDGGRQLIFSGNIINPQPAATETSIAQGLLRANFLAGD